MDVDMKEISKIINLIDMAYFILMKMKDMNENLKAD